MIQALKRFYSVFGDRGVMFIMFAANVVMHSLLSIYMELPAVNPDEIGVLSVSAFYTGKDWSGLMGQIGYYYGYVQALFYAPLFLIFKNPYSLYKACLVINGILISFIPLIAYDLCGRLGIEKVWKKLAASFCAGSYITYIAHSKFLWNEAICSVLPWVLLWLMIISCGCAGLPKKIILSAVGGLLCAVCYAAHSRLIAVVIAFALTVIIARIFMKKQTLLLPVFLPVLAGGFLAEHFLKKFIQQRVWDGKASGNTIGAELDRLTGLFGENGFVKFIATLFGHLYTFVTSTAGIGAIAFTVFFLIIFRRISDRLNSRRPVMIDGVEVHTNTDYTYDSGITVTAVYAFLAVGGSMLLSVLFKFNSGQFEYIKDLPIFGRYTDNTAPLAVFLVMLFLFRYGLNIKHIAWSAGVYAYICFEFFVMTFPYVEKASVYRESPILGLLPWRIGEDFTQAVTTESFIIITSTGFSVLALFAVFCICTRKNVKALISGIMCCIFIYTTIFAGVSYLPFRAEKNAKKTLPARLVSSMLYNEKASPTIVCHNTSTQTPGLIQFLNPETTVTIIRKVKNIPDNCIIITNEEELLPFEESTTELIGTQGGLSVYAHGEAARDYMKYKRSSEISLTASEESVDELYD